MQTVCRRLQQDVHEQSAASTTARQEIEHKDSQLEALQSQQQGLSNSKVCNHCLVLLPYNFAHQ